MKKESSQFSHDVPVLLLVFNRPEQTRIVLRRIAEYAPKRLYVVGDGARPDNLRDRDLIGQVREIVQSSVNWPCSLHTRFRDVNFGCAQGVVDGVSWFFREEESGLILEDDCLPDASFFPFCAELLERFRSDKRIWSISGDNFHRGRLSYSGSYYFSQYFHCWGWASWRRAWEMFPSDPIQTYKQVSIQGLADHRIRIPIERHCWQTIAALCAEGYINSWDYAFLFQSLSHKALHIHPSVNLVSNIGIGAEATHTSGNEFTYDLGSMGFPLIHPPEVCVNLRGDALTRTSHFRFTLCGLIMNHARLLKHRLAMKFFRQPR